MKKFLSLVLALAMTMSLVTISAGAKDFTDADDITYVEAVEVMSEIGVVDGDTAGNFNPTAGLTRGAAAKIICNLILGPTTASALNADANPYVDVDKNSTFAGYIAFCQKEGIISGYADGTFKPAAPLTGYAFMKMLLGALGYDVEVEGYTGSNWSINVAKRALNIGLDDGLTEAFNGSAYVTREEAMLYAFNALQADMVEYDTTITIGDVTVAGSKAAEVENNTKTDGNIDRDGVMQFAEKYFTNLKAVPTSDVFARPATTWKLKTTEIGTYTDAADLTYTTTVKMGTIYTDLGLSKGVASSAVDVYEDGVTTTKAGLSHTDWDNYDIAKGSRNEIGGNGDLIEVFYDDDANTATITVTHTYAGDVTSVYAATSVKDAFVTVTGRNTNPTGNFETEAFAIDDVVMYNYSRQTNEGVKNLALAEVVTGTMTGYTVNKSVTVGGTTYKANSTDAASMTDKNLSSYKTYEVKVALDQYGYALDVDTTLSAKNYAVVLDWTTGAGTFANSKVAKLLFTDGTVQEVSLANDAKDFANSYSDVGKIGDGDIVRFAVNNKDEYTLTLLADAHPNQIGLNNKVVKNGDSSIRLCAQTYKNSDWTGVSTVATGKTIFLVATKSGSDTIYTAYTGIKNVPTVNVTRGIPVTVYNEKAGIATLVYIDATADATVSSSNKDVVFIKGTSKVVQPSYDSEIGTYYLYTAIVNGEVEEDFKVRTENHAGGADGALYTVVDYDADGVATLSGKLDKTNYADILTAEGGIATTGTVRATNDVIGLGSNYYGYAKDCKVFFIDADGEINVSSIGAISDDSDDYTFFKLTDGEISSLFVVQKGVNADPVGNNSANYSVSLTNKNGTATLTVTSKSTTAADVSGTVTINNTAGSETTFDITEGTCVSGANYTFTFSTVSTATYKATVVVGGETLTTSTIIGG